MPASGNAISAFAVWAMIIGWTSPLACIVSVALASARLMASWQVVSISG